MIVLSPDLEISDIMISHLSSRVLKMGRRSRLWGELICNVQGQAETNTKTAAEMYGEIREM